MDHSDDICDDKNVVNKARSFNPPSVKLKSEPAKRKSFNVNEAVRSLDFTLGRLKKSKLVNGECRPVGPGRQEAAEMFMDICNSSPHFAPGLDNASMMSMNFSHYELLRNLSRSNCNSEGGGAFSGNTSSTPGADNNVKDEHLERYFRSIEMFSRKYREGGPSSVEE